MIFGQDRNELRRMYADAWRKFRDGAVLSPLEAQIAQVVGEHPEYHASLDEDAVQRDYSPDDGRTNPFLHMGLHLAVREQLATNRPPGIRQVHATLRSGIGDAHTCEHRMIDCLAEILWQSQRDNSAPDEQRYLERLRQLLD
jgi:hypothetical protein